MPIRSNPLFLLALSGDQLTTPADTFEAYWSAIGAGADGLALTVRLTADLIPICLAQVELSATTGDTRRIDEINASELAMLDAGCQFRSTELNADNRPTGKRGDDLPWLGAAAKQRNVTHSTLRDILRMFGRRCEILLLLPENMLVIHVSNVVDVITDTGLSHRVTVAGSAEQLKNVPAPIARALLTIDPLASITIAHELEARTVIAPFMSAFDSGTNLAPALLSELMAAIDAANLALMLSLDANQPAPPPAYKDALWVSSPITALLAPAVLATAEVITSPALMIHDDFKGSKIDQDIWNAGYSHINQDTQIYQQDGLHIVIRSGGVYSGAAAVCHLPIHGKFDARIGFYVENPHQGTTFEMAAISIDPGYFHIDNSDLDSRSVNLTFDVHGAPPYASSECDENDGFRCGWNNGFNLTRIDADWNADSVNMYNKYGRDVGSVSIELNRGELRLVRNGAIFATYYRDAHNRAWVNSGAMLVHNLSTDIFIRLAAKHWVKQNPEPPNNHVTFYNFCLYQN